MQTELSEAYRKLAENIKEANRLKHQIKKGADINGKPNTIDVSIDEDINIMRNNVNDERFIDEFVDFKKFVTVEFQNIKQKIANLNKKDQYPQGNNLNVQQEEWKEAHNSSKISGNSTKRYKPIASRNKFQPIYTEPIDLKEDDAHVNDLLTNNLVTQNTRRQSPVVNECPDRDLLHHQIKKATTSVVPGNTDFSNAVKFVGKTYILGTSMIKGVRRKEFNSKLSKCSAQFRPFIGATLKQMETYVKPILNDDTPDVLILHTGCNDIGNKRLRENEIAKWIVKIGQQCKESNINDVFISSLIGRAQKRLNDKVVAANNILKRLCKLNGLGFIDNSNICAENLFRDGLHLNDDGKVILGNNFIYVLNTFIL